MKKLLALLLLPILARSAIAGLHVVGEKHQWKDGVNYTGWSLGSHFYQQDWLVFYFQKGMYDVVQVRNESAYNRCIADDPILNWSRGHSFAMQLNHTGRYYFICSRGYCYSGMRFSILVEPLPAPSPQSPASPPSSTSKSVVHSSFWSLIAFSAAVFAALL